MKKIILSAAIIVFAGLTATAQKQPGHHKIEHPHHAGGQDKMMMKQLDLSDAQKQKMKSINQDFRSKMQELNKNETISVKEQRDQKAALIKNRKTQMDAVLTGEQKTTLTRMKKERQEKMKQHQEKRFEKMKTELGLSNEQSARLQDINQDFRSKMEAIKNNESTDRATKKEQLNALKEQHKKDFKNVLTTEQQQKLKDRKKAGKEKRFH